MAGAEQKNKWWNFSDRASSGSGDVQPGGNDLAIAKSARSPQTSPQLSIKRFYIDAELESLLRLAPVADAIEVSEPVASLTHLGAGRYDIDDVLDRLETPAGQPASAPPAVRAVQPGAQGRRAGLQ